MMQSDRQEKICVGCEATISATTQYCPYCGCDIKEEEQELFEQHSQNSSTPATELSNLASLYKPPYTPNQKGFGVPSFQDSMVPSEVEQNSSSFGAYPQEETQQKKAEVGFWPLLFLSIGSNLMTIGLLLFFFSDRGKLILEWNSYYWFVYCILATPLLMFGYRLLTSSESENP